MKNIISPGTSKFLSAFYKVQGPRQQKNYPNKALSITQRLGIFFLIPKEYKDRIILANWRPLTLLNSIEPGPFGVNRSPTGGGAYLCPPLDFIVIFVFWSVLEKIL